MGFTANQHKKVIDVANHLTIYCDAFGQLCDIFHISGGHFSGEIKSYL